MVLVYDFMVMQWKLFPKSDPKPSGRGPVVRCAEPNHGWWKECIVVVQPFFFQLLNRFFLRTWGNINNSGFIKNKVPVAEDPKQLIGVINSKFLADPENRPHEPLKSCFKMDHIRDFKTWLAACGRKTVGIFGPSAPHVFEFRLRSRYLAEQIRFVICDFSLGW